MAESTVTSKGQITIPKAVRERLHLEAGDTVYFDVQPDGSVVLATRRMPAERLLGLLKGQARLKRPIAIAEMNPASLDDRDT